jgi:hypothetical protein
MNCRLQVPSALRFFHKKNKNNKKHKFVLLRYSVCLNINLYYAVERYFQLLSLNFLCILTSNSDALIGTSSIYVYLKIVKLF